MIILRSEKEIESIKRSCEIVADILEDLKGRVAVGVRTKDLDKRAEELIKKYGVEPAFKGYKGFPACICASINEEVVHGIPGDRILKDKDIISIDVGVKKNGYFGDGAVTVGVGNISKKAEDLIETTRQALRVGIEKAYPSNRLSDISHAIQVFAESKGYSVVRDFAGHGIGSQMHEDPQIPNFGEPNRGPRLKPGMVLALEPMVNEGTWQVKVRKDGWTVETKDKKLSAHFEQVIAITENGPQILTLCQKKN